MKPIFRVRLSWSPNSAGFKQIGTLSRPEFPTHNVWITPLTKSVVVRMKRDKVFPSVCHMSVLNKTLFQPSGKWNVPLTQCLPVDGMQTPGDTMTWNHRERKSFPLENSDLDYFKDNVLARRSCNFMNSNTIKERVTYVPRAIIFFNTILFSICLSAHPLLMASDNNFLLMVEI